MKIIGEYARKLKWTHFALLYIAIKPFIVPTITWSETLGIVLVLVVHYAKALIPEQKTLVSYDEDFFGEIKRLRKEVGDLKSELNGLKLVGGLIKNPLRKAE